MAKKNHRMTTQEEFDNHSNQLNPNHEEYKRCIQNLKNLALMLLKEITIVVIRVIPRSSLESCGINYFIAIAFKGSYLDK